MRIPFAISALLCGAFLGSVNVLLAQSTWRTDSLMASWTVQHQLKDLHGGLGRGVVRAVDTRDLYIKLTHEAPSIPVFADSAVIRYADQYGQPLREHFRVLLGLANNYFPLIEKELGKDSLPLDLKYLPMALSALNTQAGSTSGEAGLWMLNYPVALRYGLKVTAEVDERHDDVKSTEVAVRYLKDLHDRYQDWSMAIMAFACGPANVTRAQQRTSGAADYRSLYPHFTTDQQDVLPLLMAFIHLTNNAGALGLGAYEMTTWEPTDTLTAPHALPWATVAGVLDLPEGRLHAINPTLIGPTIPMAQVFNVPEGMRSKFLILSDSLNRIAEAIEEAPKPEPVTVEVTNIVRYKVRSGDNLGSIATKYHVSIRQLKAWNSLRSDRIYVGKRLVIHQKKREVVSVRSKLINDQSDVDGPTNSTKPKVTTEGKERLADTGISFATYTVQSGDSVYRIALRFPGVTAHNIMEANGIDARIIPGQKLKIPRP